MEELSVRLRVRLAIRFKLLTKVMPTLVLFRLINYKKANELLRKSLKKCDVEVI